MMEDDTGSARMLETLDVVAHSVGPVLVMRVPSEIITAASPGALELLGQIAKPVVGRSLEEFTEGHPSGALALMAAGRLSGYETVRVLRITGQKRRIWVRALREVGPDPLAIATLMNEDDGGHATVPWRSDESFSPVLGSTDARLMVDRISGEVFQACGWRPDEIIGTSLLSLIAPASVPGILSALAETSTNEEGVALRVDVVRADHEVIGCQVVVIPLRPAPSCAFAVLPDNADGGPTDGRTVAAMIARLGHGIRGAVTSQMMAEAPIRSDVDLSRLSSRELDVVSRLMAGDRVCAIATHLFLSEGTVRNHLSTVYKKLGVKSQAPLIALLRPDGKPRR